MKAKDIITPGDYEVRPYKGGEHKVTVTKVEKRTVRVHPDGSFEGYDSLQWRAISEYEHEGRTREVEYPLAQVIRPWAEAEPEHEAEEAFKAEGQRIRDLLQETLAAHGVRARVDGNVKLSVSLGRASAEALVELLNKLPVD